MLYASSMQKFKRALDVNVSVYADILEELEWEVVLKEVSGGQA
jgi:cofilin